MAVSARAQALVTGASTAPAITLPAGILGGDVIIVTFGWNNGGATGVTCTAPAGYTLLGSRIQNSTSQTLYWKIAAGTTGAASADAGAAVSATMSASKSWCVGYRVLTGNHLTAPIHAWAQTSSSFLTTTHTAPIVTVTIAGCYLLEGYVARDASTSYTPPAAVSTRAVTAGPVNGAPTISGSADAGAAVAISNQGGDTWTGTASTSDIVLWTIAVSPPVSAPTARFGGGSNGGLTITLDGTTSTAVSPATITGYDWNWGDATTHGTGATPTHKYATAGTYTITLTVTDSTAVTGTTTAALTVTAPSAVVLPASITATGYIPTGGTELAVFLDASEATFDTSPTGGGVKTYYFAEIAAPLAGQGLYFETLTDRIGSTSGTFTAKLYQDQAKTILISTITGITIPDGTASGAAPNSTITPPVIVNFPAAAVATMTDFSTPTVELTVTVA